MAKKTKRKVSQVGVSTSQAAGSAAAVAEAPEAPVTTAAPTTSFAPRTFNRKATTTTEFNPDYTYVVKDLKRIGMLAGSFFVLLIARSFILPLIIK